MDVKFDSLEQLYSRIKPALSAKKGEMLRDGYNYIREEDIWNYFKEVKWVDAADLSLHQMVDDIINIDSYYIDEYLKGKLNLRNRRVYFED